MERKNKYESYSKLFGYMLALSGLQLYRPVDEVAQVVEKLTVVLPDKVSPAEGTILGLWPDVEEIESPDVCWDTR